MIAGGIRHLLSLLLLDSRGRFLSSAGTSPEFVGESRHASGGSGNGRPEYAFRSPQRHSLSCPGNGGIDQFAGEYRRIPVGQNEHHGAEFRALAFVNRHSKDRFVFGEPQRVKGSESAFRPGEEDAGTGSGEKVGQKDAHISVKEAQVVVVAPDKDGPACVPRLVLPQKNVFLEEVFDQPIEGRNPARSFPHCTKDSELCQGVKDFVDSSRCISARL
jgi:hypothetical protein